MAADSLKWSPVSVNAGTKFVYVPFDFRNNVDPGCNRPELDVDK